MTARLLIVCPDGDAGHGAPVANTLALWLALAQGCAPPALVAGYGGGDLAAHSIAGALGATDAVWLAAARGKLMHDCLLTYPGQVMLAIDGPSAGQAAILLADDLFHIAIDLNDHQCIAGGPLAGLGAVIDKIHAAGGRCRRLPGRLAAHTVYMAPAVPRYAALLRHCRFGDYAAPVLSGLDASRITGKASAIEHLSRQLAEPVRWTDCMDLCAAAGITAALELRLASMPPGAALAPALQARHPAIRSRAVADFNTLDDVRRWLARCGLA